MTNEINLEDVEVEEVVKKVYKVRCATCNEEVQGTSMKHLLHNVTQHQEKHQKANPLD